MVSTGTTAGLANPFISVGEDIAAFVTALLAMLAPVLIPLVLAVMLFGLWQLWRFVRRPSVSRRPSS